MLRLLRELVPAHALTLLVSETVLFFCTFILSAYLVLDVDPAVYLLYDGGLGRIGINVLIWLTGIHLHDLYSRIRIKSRIELVQQGCQVAGIAFLAQALLGYVSPDMILPRWLMLAGSGLSLVAFVGWRLFYCGAVMRAIGEESVLFVGCSALVAELAEHLAEHPELGLRVEGYVDDGEASADLDAVGLRRLGATKDLQQIVAATQPDLIVVGPVERRGNVPLGTLLELRFSGLRIEEAAFTFEKVLKRVSLRELRPGQLIYSGELGPARSRLFFQFVYSGIIALAGLILSLPIMLVVALAIKLTSPGPVFYRQTRVGWKGQHFTLYKFRSMRADAERATGPVWASKDDPRITPVGRWLRRLRVDEIPQFWNVLRGDMSLVGPRPERPEFVEELSRRLPFYRLRLYVKPGITGWAQINHKYGDTIEDAARKLEYDLYYIKHLSPALDAYVIFHTIKTVILTRGAQ